MSLDAQIVIRLDSAGTLFAETVGQNGMRKKITLDASFKQREPEIMAALQDRQDEIRRAEFAKLRDTQTANIEYCAANHPQILHKVWGTNTEIFNQRVRKHLRGEAGNLSSKKEPEKLNLNIQL